MKNHRKTWKKEDGNRENRKCNKKSQFITKNN